jgi:hypothetical protein
MFDSFANEWDRKNSPYDFLIITLIYENIGIEVKNEKVLYIINIFCKHMYIMLMCGGKDGCF